VANTLAYYDTRRFYSTFPGACTIKFSVAE
jgi:hypothetical protein